MRYKNSARIVLMILIFIVGTIDNAAGQDFFSGGQSPRLNLIDRADGLPHNSVSSIQQDVRGFLWFGTQGGLTRYDGRSYRTYKNIPFDPTSLPHDLVQTIYYSEDTDTLWIGTYNGLARYRLGEPGITSFQHDPDDPTSLSDNVVVAIAEGPEGRVWVGTQNGLNILNEDGTFERIPIDGEVVRALYLDSEERFWVGTYQGLFRWDSEAEELVRLDFGWSSPFTMAITENEEGDLLLGTWGNTAGEGGLVEVDIAGERFQEWRFEDNRVYTILAGMDGTYWTGTWGGGLYAITSDGERYSFSKNEDDGLASPVVYSLFEDEAGLVWVGTNGGGVHYMSPRQRNFRKYYHNPDDPDSLPPGKINVITRDSNGNLWVGLYSGGLARLAGEDNRWITYGTDENDPYALVNDIVTEIYEDTLGRLWIGTNEGLQMYDEENDRFLLWGRDVYPGVEYSGDIIYQLEEDGEGNLWIGTYHGGVTRVAIATGETRTYVADPDDPNSLSNNLVYDIYRDSRDELWIATNGGLNRWDPTAEQFHVYRYDPNNDTGLTSNTVRVLYEDTSGTLWVGTVSGGLNRYDRVNDRFTHLTERDGLSDNSIVSILEGENGRLWLGTQQGLTSYDPDSGLIDTLTEQDGLFGSEFQNGAWQDEDGTLLFGASHGITAIDSSVELQNTHPPYVQIVDVQVFQESIDPVKETFNDATVTLGARENFVGFEFIGLDFESPESNRYDYQLVGFDRERINAGNRNYATYTNVPAGEYEFLVWSANNDGTWTPTPARLSLHVVAPWYLRWWAFTIYGFVAVLFVFGGIRWRTAAVLTEKNRDLEYANSQLEVANAELERLSVRDSLTGLFNRRYFDARLLEEWFRARRSNQSISLLMIDIDHFKRFNDTYGHIVGDQVLTATATVLEQGISRKTDFVARYGGEEFVALLYDTTPEGALTIAERIRVAVAEQTLPTNADQITISIGVCAMIPRSGTPPELLAKCADAALYQAKQEGRNRVVLRDADQGKES